MHTALRWYADGVGVWHTWKADGSVETQNPTAFQTRYFCREHQRHEVHHHDSRGAAEADVSEVECNGQPMSFVNATYNARMLAYADGFKPGE